MAERIDPRVTRTRSKVLDAAAELIAAVGLQALTVDAVVRRTGVARSTIYRHWDSVEALAADALRELVGVESAQAPPLPAGADLGDDLATVLSPLVLAGEGRRARIGLLPALLAEADRAGLAPRLRGDVAAALLDPIEHLVERAVADGQLPDHIDSGEAARHVLGPLVVQLFLMAQPVSADDIRRLSAVVAALPPPQSDQSPVDGRRNGGAP